MNIPFTDYHILAFSRSYDPLTAPLDAALQNYFKTHKSLGSKDRRTIGNTVYGMVRWKSYLEKRGGDLEHQLLLYKELEKENFHLPATFPSFIRAGCSKFLFDKICSIFGEKEAFKLSRLFNEEAPISIRANALKISREELLTKLQKKFSAAPSAFTPHGILFSKREPLLALPEFKEGLFEIQDEGSQKISSLVKAKPGDLVLDYCSGSGGKTLAFAPNMQGKGQIFLHDIRPSILAQGKKRLKRAGVQNAQVLLPDHPQLKKLVGKCHWVLADVPCTGTGTLRRNPEQKWRIDQPLIDRFLLLQREIIEKALLYLHPEGAFVYATCSLLPEENEDQAAFIQKNFSLELVEPPVCLLPESKGPDGFFAAVFRKKGS